MCFLSSLVWAASASEDTLEVEVLGEFPLYYFVTEALGRRSLNFTKDAW
jgi:hypothetical protein